MVDQLVMLLSTDWFMPFWETLGINADDIAKRSIQQGCRRIVDQILAGADSYYHISFARERVEETRSLLLSVADRAATDETLRVVAERWDKLSDEDQKAAWMWSALTLDVLSVRLRAPDNGLDPGIVETIFREHETYYMEAYEFAAICEQSRTSWDQYTRTLMDEQPTALADTLASVLTSWRFEKLWYLIRNRLSSEQKDELIAWYRRMGEVRARRDLIPSYVN